MGIKVREWPDGWYVVVHKDGKRTTKKFPTKEQAEKRASELRRAIARNGNPIRRQHKSGPIFIKPFDDSNCSSVCEGYLLGKLYMIEKDTDKLDHRKFIEARQSFIYGIHATNGLLKIGVAANVRARFSVIEGNSPIAVRLVFCVDANPELETLLHQYFRDKRHHGEWFDIDFQTVVQSVVDYLKSGPK